jgi:hypothetical protein
VTAFLIPIIAIAVLVGLGFAFGGPALAVLLVLAGLVALSWLLLVARSRRSPAEVTRRARKHEFFGPGGPDDPDR